MIHVLRGIEADAMKACSRAKAKSALYMPPHTDAQILVCQAGTCRHAGGEAVLLEIEELAQGLGCDVRPSGCVGACGQAPNAVVVKKRSRETLHTRLDDVEASVAVVKEATGIAPSLEDPALRQRLTAARKLRVRRSAKEELKWNGALDGLAEQIASTTDPNDKLNLQFEHVQLSHSAGQYEQALEQLAAVEAVVGTHAEVLMEKGKLLGKLGRTAELDAVLQQVRAGGTAYACGAVKSAQTDAEKRGGPEQPRHGRKGCAVLVASSVAPVRHQIVWRNLGRLGAALRPREEAPQTPRNSVTSEPSEQPSSPMPGRAPRRQAHRCLLATTTTQAAAPRGGLRNVDARGGDCRVGAQRRLPLRLQGGYTPLPMTARRFASQWCDPSPRTASHPRTRSAARRTCAGAGAPCGTRRGTRPCSRRCALRCARPARRPACPPAHPQPRAWLLCARMTPRTRARARAVTPHRHSPRLHRAFTAPRVQLDCAAAGPHRHSFIAPRVQLDCAGGPQRRGPAALGGARLHARQRLGRVGAWRVRHPHQGLPTPTYTIPPLCRSPLSRPHTDSPLQRTQSGLPRKLLCPHAQVYPDGAATGWLHRQPLGTTVWLSKPMKTLDVPSLVRATAPAAARSITTHAHTPVRGRIELSGVVRCGAAG